MSPLRPTCAALEMGDNNAVHVQDNVPLAPLTTFGVGGPARYFIYAERETHIPYALDFAESSGLPLLPLGGGSNLVISDVGFPGVVLKTGLMGVRSESEGDIAYVTAGAGEDWDTLVRLMAARNWAGVECLAGIPGTVGATPVQNVGAYGQEVAETIRSVRAYDRQEKRIVELSAAECGFGYRRSRFNTSEPGRWIILSVTFALRRGGAATLKYADLARRFPPDANPTLMEVYEAVRAIRAAKGMVIDPADPDSQSAGSFFKNPTLTAAQFAELSALAPEIPHYPQPDGTIKVPAAWLIEQAGYQKGQAFGENGRIALSSKHILALTNRGGGTAAEIVAAARQTQEGVHARWNILLAPEPLFVGFPPDAILPDGAASPDAVSPR